MQRTVRSLCDIRHFKANEYKNLAFYTLPVITLFQFSDNNSWHMINILVHSLRILSSNSLRKDQICVAQQLLDIFVKKLPHFVHEEALTFNIHSLRHMSDHVQQFGSLPNLHTAVFESWLGWCKTLLSGTNNTLAVVARRYIDFKRTVPIQKDDNLITLGNTAPIENEGNIYCKFIMWCAFKYI